jgi:hypothetical protein
MLCLMAPSQIILSTKSNPMIIKKIIFTLILFTLNSCQYYVQDQDKKTKKAASASERINASDNNSKSTRDELDE